MKILAEIEEAYRANRHLLAVLLDPDKPRTLTPTGADFVFVGGSTMAHPEQMSDYVRCLKRDLEAACSQGGLEQPTQPPVVLFPGSAAQFTSEADGILFLSLISGRNPDYLIGQQARSALAIKASGVEVLPTGYILLDGGTDYTTLRVTGTEPLPMTDCEAVVRTAVAGELLGLRLIYLEAGSGAKNAVLPTLIRAVREAVNLPIIVGGGLRSKEAIQAAYDAGASLCVVGNYLEEKPSELRHLI